MDYKLTQNGQGALIKYPWTAAAGDQPLQLYFPTPEIIFPNRNYKTEKGQRTSRDQGRRSGKRMPFVVKTSKQFVSARHVSARG